eukprot:5883272-Prymnesium_polylepis.1
MAGAGGGRVSSLWRRGAACVQHTPPLEASVSRAARDRRRAARARPGTGRRKAARHESGPAVERAAACGRVVVRQQRRCYQCAHLWAPTLQSGSQYV